MKTIQLIVIILSTLFFSCKFDNDDQKVQIYNPTNEEMVVNINDTTYTLAAREIIDTDIHSGKYTITSFIANSKLVDTVLEISKYDISEGLLLNLSGERLFSNFENYESAITAISFVSEIFLVEDSLIDKLTDTTFVNEYLDKRLNKLEVPQHKRRNMTAVAVENYIIAGFLIEFPANQIKVPVKWSYGPNTPYPAEIEVENKNSNLIMGTQVGKLFNSQDLIQHYFLNYMRDENDTIYSIINTLRILN